jgi:hypothetical protein
MVEYRAPRLVGRYVALAPHAVLRAALVGLLVLVCASCGGAAPPPVAAPSAPAPALTSWVGAAIGGAPDLSFFVRPTAARSDAYWGPLLSRVLSGQDKEGDFIGHGSGTMILTARQIDMHFAIRDPLKLHGSSGSKGDPSMIAWVGVLYGVMPLDPLGLRSGAGRPLFAPPYRLPTGVLAYPPAADYAHEYGILAPTLFVTPDGTSIVTDGGSAVRARDLLATNAAAPPPLQAANEALAGTTFGVTSMRFLNAGKNDRASMMQGMIDAGFGLRGGATGSIEGYADYATSDDATRAYTAFQRTCAEKMDTCALEPGWFKDAKAEQTERRIVVKLAFSDALLRSLQSYAP